LPSPREPEWLVQAAWRCDLGNIDYDLGNMMGQVGRLLV